MSDNTTINYRIFFEELVPVFRWPFMIIDTGLVIRYFNQRAQALFETD